MGVKFGKDFRGLKKLRSTDGKDRPHNCNNCKCVRYNPCGCQVGVSTQTQKRKKNLREHILIGKKR